MRKVGLKFGGMAWAVSQARTTKVVVTQRRETQKRKKTTKKEKRSDTEKKKKVTLVIAGLDLTAFLKGPEGRPLDHRHVPIRAFHTHFDLLSIHIGSSSNIQRKQMDKKRVLQRVLRYYHGSTRFG